MKRQLFLSLMLFAATAAASDPLSPPIGEGTMTEAQLSPAPTASDAMTDTLAFNFNASTEGWGFTFPANQVQEYYPNLLCVQVYRMITDPVNVHSLGWNSLGGGSIQWTCPMAGWNTSSCNYSWRIKSISVPVPTSWQGAFRIEARLNSQSAQTIYAKIGYKVYGDTVFRYLKDWPFTLSSYNWTTINIAAPDTLVFRNISDISILIGAYGYSGSIFIDWVKGYKPSAPAVLAPASGATIDNNRPLMQWSPTADRYDWEYSGNTEFKPSTVVANITTNQYALPAGLPNGLYYWRVRAYTTGGTGRSDYSATASFTIAGDLNVPSEFPTISDALAAIPRYGSGTIVVAPGTYGAVGNVNLTSSEKVAVIKSSGGAASTVIDCGFNASFFTFDLYTPGGVTIDGLTVTNTKMESIQCYGSTGTVRNCVIRSNSSSAGLYVYSGGTLNVSNCGLENNGGAGLRSYYGKANVDNTVFKRNTGSAVSASNSRLNFTSCLFDSNYGGTVGAIYATGDTIAISRSSFARNIGLETVSDLFLSGSPTTIQYSLFTRGMGHSGVISGDAAVPPTLTCCDIYGNQGGDWVGIIAPQATVSGNFALDPLLCDTTQMEPLNVTANSPCLTGNNSCGTRIGTAVSGCSAMAMVVTPDSIVFNGIVGQPNPPRQALGILNAGSGYLRWSATSLSKWLSHSVTAGIAPSTDSLSVDIAAMKPGTQADTVRVYVTGTTLPVASIPVWLTVIPPNRPPVITHVLPQAVSEGASLIVPIMASDSDKTIPKLSALNLPANASFIDSGNGSGLFIFNPDYTQAGHYSVTIKATDAVAPTLFDTMTIGITVNNVNRLPSFTSVPGDSVRISEGDNYQFAVRATDPDNDPLSITCSGLPPNAQFTDSGNGAAALIFHSDQSNADQTYHVVFSVTDNIGSPVTSASVFQIKLIPLEITKFVPDVKTGENDVLVNSQVQVLFSKDLDPVSIGSTVRIRSAKGDHFLNNYNPDTRTITFDKGRAWLAPLDTITVTISADLQDLSGHRLGTPFVRTVYTGTIVYPGDANHDGVDDERDILPVAFYWGNTGPTRDGYPNPSWAPTPGHHWSPAAASYADADGSGVVDANDICTVIANWEKQVSGTAAPKRPVFDGEIQNVLAGRDSSVLAAMYAGVTTCPQGVVKQKFLDILAELLLKGEPESTQPNTFALYQNYPNPFNPNTDISFDLPRACNVTLEIFDASGRRVAVVTDGAFPAGAHTVRWEGLDGHGRHVASGVYLYRLIADEFVQTRKMLFLK